jgi:hypothetical protein
VRKLLVILTLVVVTLSFAIIPGMQKKLYGGYASIWPFPLAIGVSGYYMEGMQVYSLPDMNVDIDAYVGPGFSSEFATIGFTSGFGAELNALISLVVTKKDWNFELFGYKITPALKIDSGLYYSFAGADYGGYSVHASGFGIIMPDFYLTFFADWMKGKYASFYFWPFPLVLGFSVVEY